MNWVLVVLGTALAMFPLLATVVLSVLGSAMEGRFVFDFLLPAELFPVAGVGAVLLVIAAWRMKRRRRVVVGSMFSAAGLLLASQGVAVLTGLASGAAEPVGWRVGAVLGLLAGFVIALIALVWSGWSLLRDLTRATARPR